MLDLVIPYAETVRQTSLEVWNATVMSLHLGAIEALSWLMANVLPAEWHPSDQTLQFVSSPEFRDALEIALAAVVFVLGVLMLRRLFRRRSRETASLMEATRRPRRLGLFAIVALVAFFGGWSVLAPLESATVAEGIVSPDGHRKTVAHLEGGIVKTIHVREGEFVRANQPLLTLEDIQAKARLQQVQKRYLHLLATEARLLAERAQDEGISFPSELLASDDPEALLAVEAQTKLFESRRESQASHKEILKKRTRQLEEQNGGLEEVFAAQSRQLDLLAEEIASVEDLLGSGLERRPRLLALKRSEAELQADRASIRAQMSENALKIGETEIQLLNITELFVDEVNDRLADVQRVTAELKSQLPSSEDILNRTVVRAPLAGTVMNVRVTTESGVIGAGEPILEIVPDDEVLVVDARVRPNDIDRLHPGMETRVILSAYKQRNLPLIRGTLRTISADRLVEDRTGEPYFLAKVDVSGEDIDRIEDVELLPGMAAEVMILNGSQTFLDYLLEPLVGSLRRGMRES